MLRKGWGQFAPNEGGQFDRILQYTAYASIYATAIAGRPADDYGLYNAERSWESRLAIWAKYCAFVYLIGLDNNATSIIPTTRFNFKTDAIHAFEHWEAQVSTKNGQKQTEGKSIMAWLQAYDYLKATAASKELTSLGTTYVYYSNYDSDRNDWSCSPRNRLRKAVKDFYEECEGVFGVITSRSGWKKNHGLAAAAVLGMAAVVLNDAGVETNRWKTFTAVIGLNPFPRPDYSPLNWYDLANDGIRDCLFTGAHWSLLGFDVPQTNSDGTAGYAEGPGYWIDAVSRLLPAWRAMNNFYYQGDSRSWLNQPSIQNLLSWCDSIQTNNGYLPTYDNTHAIRTNVQCLAGDPHINDGTTDGLTSIGMLVDYIVQVATHNNTPRPRTTEGITILEPSGDAIMRMGDGKSNHYGHMLFENTAPPIDIASNSDNGTHEDADIASFMIAADNDWLAIDPPYITYSGGGGAAKTNQYKHHNVLQFAPSSTGTFTVSGIRNPVISDILKFDGKKQHFRLGYDLAGSSTVKRKFEMYKTLGVVYYVMKDYIDVGDGAHWTQMSVNGNGFINDVYSGSTKTFVDSTYANRTAIWRHPCTLGSTHWALLTHYTATGANVDTLTFSQVNSSGESGETLHGDQGETVTKHQANLDGQSYGFHTRLNVKQHRVKTIFQTVYFPFQCGLSV